MRKSLRITVPFLHRSRRSARIGTLAACGFALVFVALGAQVRSVGENVALADDARPLVHHVTSTHDRFAQREFDLGLERIYAFDPEDALAHFQEAGRRDPSFAMAYYGIALAAGPNVNVGYDLARASVGRAACAQAAILGRTATPLERDLIAALAKRYDVRSTADVATAQAAYARAMDGVATRYPNDADVATLAAESAMDLTPLRMWRSDGTPGRDTPRTIALLRSALALEPRHIGANHYLIHVYERSPYPERALAAARVLDGTALAPEDEHLAHMPEHVYLRLGMAHAAEGAGERAVRLFRVLLARPHATEHDGYFHHDLQLLDTAYEAAGRWQRARAIASEVARQVDDNEAAVECYARFGRFRELLALAPPAHPGVRWHFARGLAASETGDRRMADAESATLHGATGNDPRLTIARDVLDASIANRSEHLDRAIASLRNAVRAQDALALAEPPRWYAPVRESLGARLYEARRFPEARRVFEAELARDPGDARALFGLANVLDATHDRSAAETRSRFRRAWREADVTLAMTSL